MADANLIVHNYNFCPRCGSPTRRAIAFSGVESEFYFECTNCNTFIDTFQPMEHQQEFLTTTTRFTGNFGGYGTGKTYATRKEIEKHAMITPNGLIVIGAKVTSQYEMTLKRELENDIPRSWVKEYSKQKSTMELINGCQIIYRPFEDTDTLRSYNATMFVILEASEVKYEAFSQLQTRLRSDKGGIPKIDEQGNRVFTEEVNTKTGKKRRVPVWVADWRRGIIESNPDSGWIRTEFVYRSADIRFHGDVIDRDILQHRPTENIHPAFTSHIVATDANYYLPVDFYDDVSIGKPMWWISKFLHGSFAYSEGLVYPKAPVRFIDDFDIPHTWPRIVAFDYGLQDPSVFLFGAIDIAGGLLYIYKEARSRDVNVEQLAQLYFENSADIPSGGMWCTPIIDPKSGPKRDYEKKSLIDLFAEKNILFQPGHVNVDARIFRLNTYLEEGHLAIFNSLTELKWEFENYKFPDRTLDVSRNAADRPLDKNNHGVNALEWIVMALPADPREIRRLGAYNSRGQDLALTQHPREKYNTYDPLGDYDYYNPEPGDSGLAYGIDDVSQYF